MKDFSEFIYQTNVSFGIMSAYFLLLSSLCTSPSIKTNLHGGKISLNDQLPVLALLYLPEFPKIQQEAREKIPTNGDWIKDLFETGRYNTKEENG